MSVNRFDIGELAAPVKTPQGFLRVDARLARTGIYEYRTANGSMRRELRRDGVVFSSDALASFSMAPVTDGHPPEMLSPKNASQYSRGSLSEIVRRDGEFVRASMLITDADLIAKMDAGVKQVSCGYVCDLDETPGVYNGQRYDAEQLNVRGNHVAVLPKGRAGDACAARMDASDAFDGTPVPQEISVMTEKEIKELQMKLDAAEKDNARLRDEAASAKARADVAQSEAVKTAAARQDADDASKRRAEVRARVELEKVAGPILGDKIKLDTMDDVDIKTAVAEKVFGKLDAESAKSPVYVAAMYDAALKVQAKAGTVAGAKALENVRAAGEAAARTDTEERKDGTAIYCEAVKTLWQQPIKGGINRE